MTDLLTDYYSAPQKKPKLFWLVFCLYTVQVTAANIIDAWFFWQTGLAKAFAIYKGTMVLWFVDIFQILLAYLFFRKSKFAWCFIPLIQGIFASRFLKTYYTIFKVSGIQHWDLILNDPITIFFCLNCILLITLCFTPKLITYFNIDSKRLKLIVSLTLFIMAITMFFFNDNL